MSNYHATPGPKGMRVQRLQEEQRLIRESATATVVISFAGALFWIGAIIGVIAYLVHHFQLVAYFFGG